VVILVDSGSSNSFLNAALATALYVVPQMSKHVRVQVANGQVLQSVLEIINAQWSIQGVSFMSDLKILPLPYYGMIVGMDWLESHSPMRVDWLNKWITITQHGRIVQLHGLQPTLPKCSVIEVFLIEDYAQLPLDSCYVQSDLLESIQQLLNVFSHMFVEHEELPPSCSCDHSIPLVEGPQPVNVRTHMFSPAMKDEVEKQVQEMLQKGIIQASQNAFSSPCCL
jgi:hypothetical protein